VHLLLLLVLHRSCLLLLLLLLVGPCPPVSVAVLFTKPIVEPAPSIVCARAAVQARTLRVLPACLLVHVSMHCCTYTLLLLLLLVATWRTRLLLLLSLRCVHLLHVVLLLLVLDVR
jgi:hypothetical protein